MWATLAFPIRPCRMFMFRDRVPWWQYLVFAGIRDNHLERNRIIPAPESRARHEDAVVTYNTAQRPLNLQGCIFYLWYSTFSVLFEWGDGGMNRNLVSKAKVERSVRDARHMAYRLCYSTSPNGFFIRFYFANESLNQGGERNRQNRKYSV